MKDLNTGAIRILAFDLDYTLLDSYKRVTPRTRAALERAAAAGLKLVVATGRGLSTVPPIVRELGVFGYIVSANGARVTEIASGAVLHTELLGADDLAPALPYIEDPDVMREVFFDNNVYTDIHALENLPYYGVTNPANQNYIRTTRQPVEDTIPLMHSAFGRLENVNIFIGDPEKHARYLRELRAIDTINVVTSFATNIEIGARGASKGNGLAALAAHFDWGPESVMAFGDSNNDLSMIQQAGIGVAMANAQKEIIDAAAFVTLSCDEDGVAYAIETLLGI